MDEDLTTGELIKAARKKAGLTQKELGAKIGVAYQTLAQWENNLRHPKYETINRIAKALGVDTYSIMGFDDASNALFEDMARPPTPDENELLQKYRALDTHGKKVVDCVLELEFQRYQKEIEDEIFRTSHPDCL